MADRLDSRARLAFIAILVATLALAAGCDKTSGAAGAAAAESTSATAVSGTDSEVTLFHSDARGRVRATFKAVAPAAVAVPAPSGAETSAGLKAQAFAGVPTVGPLFVVTATIASVRACTAVVVHSAGGDVIMTAAHCVYGGLLPGYHADLAFVPGYHDGQAPHGVWVPTTVALDPRWVATQNPDYDYAFVTVTRADGGTGTLEQMTGADTLRINPPYNDPVDVIGYTSTSDTPISCAARTSRFTSSQLRFDCGGYSEGSSGSPFVEGIDPVTGRGTVVGVLGGYQLGGNTGSISYSSYPGSSITALYRAVGGES